MESLRAWREKMTYSSKANPEGAIPGGPPDSAPTRSGRTAEMATICSRCSHVHDQPESCPRCGAVIQVQPREQGPAPAPGPRWQQTAWGRILIGLILAQGLFYGLRHL